jgi:hypothetical protein
MPTNVPRYASKYVKLRPALTTEQIATLTHDQLNRECLAAEWAYYYPPDGSRPFADRNGIEIKTFPNYAGDIELARKLVTEMEARHFTVSIPQGQEGNPDAVCRACLEAIHAPWRDPA